ncbi:MAG TPA: MmcQ/YjbR family DNA-binding protein [Candidatus Limnocylindrales bacterium]|nr:MmcQ/YjbR family DNA-binding protein [Candidatus Limnocylindrales bacterium]
MTDEPLARLRAICLALPGATERLSHGEPTWFVEDKRVFVTYADHHHDDRLAFWCAAPGGLQEALVASSPERFFVPPYAAIAAGSASGSTSPSTGTRSAASSPTRGESPLRPGCDRSSKDRPAAEPLRAGQSPGSRR